jgi:hypothetical protein
LKKFYSLIQKNKLNPLYFILILKRLLIWNNYIEIGITSNSIKSAFAFLNAVMVFSGYFALYPLWAPIICGLSKLSKKFIIIP